MNSTKEQVISFLDKCGEIEKSKFIMAPTKIKDLLKCIVNSPELYKLFDTVTKDFNYPEYKVKCLAVVDDGFFRTKKVLLPQTVGQRLAFIFCLLVEIDKDTINLNDFLQAYFPEDGSYYSSYQAFCKTIIVSLEDLMKQIFKNELEKPEEVVPYAPPVAPNAERANSISAIQLAVEAEKQYVMQLELSGEDKANAVNILDELFCAVKSGNITLIDALISGYNYFVLFNRCVSEGIAPLIEALAEFEGAL